MLSHLYYLCQLNQTTYRPASSSKADLPFGNYAQFSRAPNSLHAFWAVLATGLFTTVASPLTPWLHGLTR